MRPDSAVFLQGLQALAMVSRQAVGHGVRHGVARRAPGRVWVLPVVLMVAACGGGGPADTPTPGAAAADASPHARPVATAPLAVATPDDRAVPPAASAPLAARPKPLHAWLHQWAMRRGAAAHVAPGLVDRMVAVPVEAAMTTDDMLAAIGGRAEVVLSYTVRADGRPSLAAVAVRGQDERRGDAAAADREAAPSQQDAAWANPALEVARLAHDLASPEEPARRQALARSFEIDTPLPLQALLSAAQGDRSGTVRRYALMAIERHPDADAAFLRTLVHRARADADPEVRRQADELAERLDADDPSAELATGR